MERRCSDCVVDEGQEITEQSYFRSVQEHRSDDWLGKTLKRDEEKLEEMPISVVEQFQGLKLDTTEPWERSLLHLLQDGHRSGLTHPTASVTDNGSSLSTLMVLEHTESRDIGFELEEDDVSILSTPSFSNMNLPLRRRNSKVYGASLLDDSLDETFSSASNKSFILKKSLHARSSSLNTAPDVSSPTTTMEEQESRGDRDEVDGGRRGNVRRSTWTSSAMRNNSTIPKLSNIVPIQRACVITHDSVDSGSQEDETFAHRVFSWSGYDVRTKRSSIGHRRGRHNRSCSMKVPMAKLKEVEESLSL